HHPTTTTIPQPPTILQGIANHFTGRVERIDTGLLQALLENDIVPVIPPLGCDGEGHTHRLNSDTVAVEVARALHAVKLIYLTTFEGIRARSATAPGPQLELLRQLSLEEAEDILTNRRPEVPPPMLSKLEQAVRAARGGV